MLIRLAKVVLVLQVGMFAMLVGVDNIIDYNSNFEFVRHVLSMDTTFPDNALMDRAITNPDLHHLAYAIIIASEIITGILCIAGAIWMARHISAPSARFQRTKSLAVAGLTLGFTLWFLGFLTIGGEWFQMWQSAKWNGQQAAFRFIACVGLVLVILLLPDGDPPAATPEKDSE
jgi:predicted small integral membrane protein